MFCVLESGSLMVGASCGAGCLEVTGRGVFSWSQTRGGGLRECMVRVFGAAARGIHSWGCGAVCGAPGVDIGSFGARPKGPGGAPGYPGI